MTDGERLEAAATRFAARHGITVYEDVVADVEFAVDPADRDGYDGRDAGYLERLWERCKARTLGVPYTPRTASATLAHIRQMRSIFHAPSA